MRSYRKVVLTNLALTAGGTGLLAIAIALASPLIVRAYGREFQGAQAVIALLAVAGVLMAVNNVIGADMVGRGKMWLGVLFCFLVSTALVCLSAWLVPRHGAVGLAIAFVGAYTLHTIWQGTYLFRTLRKHDEPPAVAAAATATAA
jgi:O-antigen/teichoic acid export membrane protein